MARISGVPTLDPISKPTESPAQAGRPGEAISSLGESVNDDTLQEQSLNLLKKRAQQSVDEIAAQNQAHAAVLQYEDQLAKTPNSRDVPDVTKAAQDTLNGIAKEWSKSPASVSIQQQVDGLMPQLNHLGDTRGIDLMGKELKINLNYQAESLAGDYAAGNRDGALAAFTSAVDSPGGKLLLGEAERGEYIRQFKIQGQELEIKNGITNANPEVNTKIYEDIDKNRDRFPDVTQEKLDTYKGQALAAFEAHTKQKDWAEGQMALQTQLVPKIDQFTNPATGHFDVGAALSDNAERMAKGEITETQSKVLAEGFDSHYTQLQVAVKQEGEKRITAVDDLLSKHNFSGARKQMARDEDWFNKNDLSADHVNEMRYMNQMESQVRAENSQARTENRYEWQLEQEKKQYDSGQLAGKVQLEIASGKVYEPMDIKTMEGLTDHDKSELISGIKDAQGFSNNPYVKDGMNKISELGILDSRKYELARVFVNQVKSGDSRGSAITAVADQLVKQAKTQHSQKWIDQLYRDTTEGRRPDSELDRFLRPIAGAPPSRPTNVPVGYSYNANGPKGAGWYAPTAK